MHARHVPPPLCASYRRGISDEPPQSSVIDEANENVMRHWMRWLDGTTFTSIDFPGAFSTNASGINDRGDIVGSYQDANFVFHGFLYDGRHYITINFPGASSTFASGINDRGDIVGSGDFGVST